MDPTTKEGRAELRETWGKRTSNMRVLRDAAPTDVRWSAEYELAAQTFALFAHIDRLEAERIRLSKFVLVREAERSALRADLERARDALRAFVAIDDEVPGLLDEQFSTMGGYAIDYCQSERLKALLATARAALPPVPAPIDPPSPASYEPSARPRGSNADEWCVYLREHTDAPEYIAVQIAEAIEDVGSEPSDAEIDAMEAVFQRGGVRVARVTMRAALIAAHNARRDKP